MFFRKRVMKNIFAALTKRLEKPCNFFEATLFTPPRVYYVSSILTVSDLVNTIIFSLKERRNEVFACKGFISSFLHLKANSIICTSSCTVPSRFKQTTGGTDVASKVRRKNFLRVEALV